MQHYEIAADKAAAAGASCTAFQKLEDFVREVILVSPILLPPPAPVRAAVPVALALLINWLRVSPGVGPWPAR
jgi:hypothetical protein